MADSVDWNLAASLGARIVGGGPQLTADEASQTGDRFVLTAVLYASVLFFAGIASKLSDPRSEHLAVGLSATMFVVASVVVLTLPHRFGF